MVLVYKSALRIISKDSELRASGTLAVLVDAVCHTTSSKLELISQQNSGLSKVLVFLLKVLSKLVSFTNRNEEICWPPLVEVILAASKGLTSIMYGEEPGDANLGLAVETLINSAIPHETFCVTFYQSAQKTGNLERNLYAVSVVHKCLSESTQYHSHWWSERHLADLTSFLTRCGNHLCLLSLNGKNKTAYEFVLTRLVGMMVTAAGQSFQPVEKLLLTLLVAPALHVNFLATDCWHFISRYSSARLSLDHCCKLLDALHELRLSDRLENRLYQVIVRLVSGMTPNIQMELVKHKNALDSGILAQVSLCKQVQAQVEAAALESMKQHLRLIGSDGLSQTEMVHSLKAIARLLFLVSQQEEWVWLSLQAANHLTEILLFNLDSHSLEYCIMLVMGSYSSRRKFHPLLLKLLHALSESFDVRSLSIRIRMLRCLSYLSTLSTAQDKKLVVQLYQRAIASKDLELRLNALESFKSFAKSTPYQELIQEVAARSSEVNEKIVNYCSGQFQNLPRNMEPWDIPDFSFNFNSTDSFQPQTKRLRLDPVDTINSLETLVTQIHQSRCQFSSAQRLRLRKISTDLTQLSGNQL
ncbi:FIGNL1-interacting regulator of recombination and mitosis-like [Watersipora subatra]|uniref:FIGNL1-interacting regulator of recombination and mitosis-like n=1 Tax=Watersipora subatra TaxID=2589382 RepID=UPI00355AEE95